MDTTEQALFGTLSDAETALAAALEAAKRDTARAVISTTRGTIRAAFLRWVLLEAIPKAQLAISTIRLDNATVEGELALGGIKLPLLCTFESCTFADIVLEDSDVLGFEMVRCAVKSIRANRLTTTGSFSHRAALVNDATPKGNGASVAGSVQLCGAKIRGNLDFRGCAFNGAFEEGNDRIALLADGMHVEGSLLLSEGFTANAEIRLNGSDIERNLDCSGGTFANWGGRCLSAAGTHVAGSAWLRTSRQKGLAEGTQWFWSNGEFRLEGAKVDGNVDCSGAVFIASFSNKGDRCAFNGDGLSVGGDFRFGSEDRDTDTFDALGQVRLVKARIGSDLICIAAHLQLAGEKCLVADGIDVGQSTYLGPKLRTNGFLRLIQGKFHVGLFVKDVIFEAKGLRRSDAESPPAVLQGGCVGLYAPGAAVDTTLMWKAVRVERGEGGPEKNVWINLANAHAVSLKDDPQSWQAVDRFDITGFAYDIPGLTSDVRERLCQLDREYAILNERTPPADGSSLRNFACRCRTCWSGIVLYGRMFWRALQKSCGGDVVRAGLRILRRGPSEAPRHRLDEAVARFTPQPYVQLAKVARDTGYDDAAKDVLVRMEHNRTRYGDLRWWTMIGRGILGIVLRYGYAPFRPLLFLVIWFFISVAVFQNGYQDKVLVPSEEASCVAPHNPAAAKVSFNAVVFTLETLVPVVDLNQRKNWTVEPLSWRSCAHPRPGSVMGALWRGLAQFPLGRLEGFFLLLNTFLGWALWGFVAAGVSGLLRRET